MKTIIYYIKPYLGRMSLGFLVKVFGTVMDLFLPYILAHIIDDIVQRKTAMIPFSPMTA